MRFFHTFGSINYDFLGLVDGVLLKAKKKNKFTSALSYFEKYSDNKEVLYEESHSFHYREFSLYNLNCT